MTANTLAVGPDREDTVLVAREGRILYLGSSEYAPSAELRLVVGEGRLEPGSVNAHTHVYSGLAPLGMPPPEESPETFVQILERVWWKLDRALDQRSLRASARYYLAESLLAGTTTLIDHHESPDFIEGSLEVLADACEELGMRAVLCFGATERNGGVEEARRGLEECRRFIRDNRRPLVRGVVGLHASFTVSDETVRRAAELCRELDTVMHVHMAEDPADVEDARRREWAGPLERLLALGALPPGSILAHGVHLTEEQVRMAADHGVWLVQNPRSNRGNQVGYPGFLGASERVALGTDGYPSRMADELEVLLEEAAAHGEDPALAARRAETGHALVEELFGISVSPLRVDGAADVVVKTEPGEPPESAVVGGRAVVVDRRLVSADLERIRSEAEAQADRLWQRMAAVG